MMKKLIMEVGRTVAAPLGRRLGTAFAAYLIAKGVPQDAAEQLLMALGVVAGVTLDLASAYLATKAKRA